MPTDQDIKDKPRTGKINYTVKKYEKKSLSHLKSKGRGNRKRPRNIPPWGSLRGFKDPEWPIPIELWEPAKE